MLRWHRAGFGRYWRWTSRRRGGRPRIQAELRALIGQMSVGCGAHRLSAHDRLESVLTIAWIMQPALGADDGVTQERAWRANAGAWGSCDEAEPSLGWVALGTAIPRGATRL